MYFLTVGHMRGKRHFSSDCVGASRLLLPKLCSWEKPVYPPQLHETAPWFVTSSAPRLFTWLSVNPASLVFAETSPRLRLWRHVPAIVHVTSVR